MSFEYQKKDTEPKQHRRNTSHQNDSYEIMELNSFNEVKNSDDYEEEHYDEGGKNFEELHH